MAQRITNIDIQPESDALKALALSREDFFQALEMALDQLEGRPMKDLPVPANIPIVIHGRERRLGELARIDVSLQPAN